MNAPEKQSVTRRLRELLGPEFMTRLDALDLMSRKILQGKIQGERRGTRRGQSVEFADHRPYVTGDDLRFIDWNIFGRLDQLFLKLFLEEQDLTLHIALDVSGSMSTGRPPKDIFARQLAAALTYIGLTNNTRVTLSVFADGIVSQLPSMRGQNYLPAMADLLLTVRPEGPSNFTKTAKQLVGTGPARGIVIVISDFMMKEGFEEGLNRLVGEKSELYAMQILSPQELSPDLTGDLKLVDIEDSDFSEVTISAELLKHYKRRLAAFCQHLDEFCKKRGAVYTRASTDEPAERLVLSHLRHLGLLR